MEQLSGNWASRYRPSTLEEFCGHAPVKNKIEGIFKDNKKPALIGITGDTGEGKTTLARIIANNLTKFPKNDIVERDMGSHGSKDDIRELARLSKYKPKGAFRVFIIDEFHLVRADASSLLLKLMEDNPPQTIFIWCTNCPEKVLNTLIGRSFMIRLGERAPDAVVPFMAKVCREEGFKFKTKEQKKEVLTRIAYLANGQPRASINMLEEVYKTVKGNGNVKEALDEAIQSIESVSPDLAAIKFMLMLYTNKMQPALKAIWDFNGNDWKQLVNALVTINTWILQRKSDVPSFPYGPRKLFSEKINTKGGLTKISFNKVIAVQNNLVDILKEWGSFAVQDSLLVPARLAQIAMKLADKD